jgi:hypothetical protein
MSRPAIHNAKLNQHLTLSECHPDSECRTNSWWLYDDRAYGSGMNIGMRAKTRDEALVEAIEFWVERAMEAEKAYSQIKGQVDIFVNQFVEHGDEDD